MRNQMLLGVFCFVFFLALFGVLDTVRPPPGYPFGGGAYAESDTVGCFFLFFLLGLLRVLDTVRPPPGHPGSQVLLALLAQRAP